MVVSLGCEKLQADRLLPRGSIPVAGGEVFAVAEERAPDAVQLFQDGNVLDMM